jgi:GTP-binding protein HflX
MFATLDPTSRRKRLPKEAEVIITDTVGFIRQLPQELVTAFRATLEELEDADLLIHVIDVSNPRFSHQIESVERILESLNLDRIPMLKVLNKQDLVNSATAKKLARKWNGVPISANNKDTLSPLLNRMEECTRRLGR